LAHANAVLTPVGRRLLVVRVLAGRPQSHVAKELGVSRQCVARWVSRFRAEGPAGLLDRSSRPRTSPSRTSERIGKQLLELRVRERLGPPELARRCGVSASTASRLIARAGLPKLFELDPVTGIQIRASRRTQLRYERAAPGDLVHVDVEKLGRSPTVVVGGAAANYEATMPSDTTRTVESVSTTSMPRSMTTPGWPMPRSWPTRAGRPAPAS